MGASAGRYGVAIGTGAASGASIGAFGGPIGAAIGAGLGGLAGGISTLLSSSDEAKERKRQLDEYNAQRAKALEAYQQQQQQSSEDDWERRYASLTGISNDPMYIAQSYDPYDPKKAEADFNLRAGPEPTFPDEPTPNYGALAQSLGSLGSTVGGLSRQADMSDRLGTAQINSSKNPWTAYADDPIDPMQELLERAREAAQRRTGGW